MPASNLITSLILFADQIMLSAKLMPEGKTYSQIRKEHSIIRSSSSPKDLGGVDSFFRLWSEQDAASGTGGLLFSGLSMRNQSGLF